MKKKKPVPKYLYHHTGFGHLRMIVEDGFLKRTASNLLPVDKATERYEPIYDKQGNICGDRHTSKSDSYKPVVWLTTEERVIPFEMGLTSEKTRVTFVFRFSPRFVPWKDFADANKMNPAWRHTFEQGRKPKTWYVCQSNINISEAVEIRAYVDCDEDKEYILGLVPNAVIIESGKADP